MAALGFLILCGLSPIGVSRGYSLFPCAVGLLCNGVLVAEAQALGIRASVAVAHELSSFVACADFPDQRSNPCPLH